MYVKPKVYSILAINKNMFSSYSIVQFVKKWFSKYEGPISPLIQPFAWDDYIRKRFSDGPEISVSMPLSYHGFVYWGITIKSINLSWSSYGVRTQEIALSRLNHNKSFTLRASSIAVYQTGIVLNNQKMYSAPCRKSYFVCTCNNKVHCIEIQKSSKAASRIHANLLTEEATTWGTSSL